MTIPIISSTSNAQVKQLIQLQKKAKLRAEQDVFIVEGIKMYHCLLYTSDAADE